MIESGREPQRTRSTGDVLGELNVVGGRLLHVDLRSGSIIECSWRACSSVTKNSCVAAIVALVLVTATGCGSDFDPASTTSPGGSRTIGSLPPGPDVDDLVSISTTDLVIVKSVEHDDALRATISELGGKIHLDSEQLGLYGVRFETADAAALAEIRDELRRRGFDASFDVESDDPTTG